MSEYLKDHERVSRVEVPSTEPEDSIIVRFNRVNEGVQLIQNRFGESSFVNIRIHDWIAVRDAIELVLSGKSKKNN